MHECDVSIGKLLAIGIIIILSLLFCNNFRMKKVNFCLKLINDKESSGLVCFLQVNNIH